MDEVGRDFKAGDLFVPEELIAVRPMHAGMGILRPLLAESDAPSVGKYLIGTSRAICTTEAGWRPGGLARTGPDLTAALFRGRHGQAGLS